jgi:hypothetical protein
MTQEEARMTGAEALKAIHGIGNTVGDKMHGLQDALQAVQDKVGGVEGMLQSMLQGVTGMSQGVDNRAQDIGDKVINGAETVQLPIFTTHFSFAHGRFQPPPLS